MSTSSPPSPFSVTTLEGVATGHDPGLSSAELLHAYRTLLTVRAFDEVCMKLQRSGRIGFSIPNRGIEAVSVGAASALDKSDWIFPSYRDFGMALYHGVQPLEMMHNMFGNGADAAKGRQMSVHFSFVKPIHFVSISSPIGTHLPQAVGAARAFQLRGEDRVCLASFGDGGTSSLGFHSALNFAGVWRAPVIFLCQNNGWAISCPSAKQTASESYAVKARAYGIEGVLVEGNDLLAVRDVTRQAVERARSGGGATLIEARTYRMGGHSTSDDPTRYVPAAELEAWEEKDPVRWFERYLARRELWDEGVRKRLEGEVLEEVDAAAKQAEKTPGPALETVFSDVYQDLPAHLRRQGQESFDLAKRLGDPSAGDGAFPL